MKVRKLAFVGIPVTDVKRARAFYEGVLSLQVSDEMMDGNWIEYELGGSTLAIASVGESWTPSDQGAAAALEVENLDESIEKLEVAGIRFAAEPFETPCCRMAVVQDPDGNKIIIHKLKPEDEKGPC
ncbi:MAG TPA: VOC family protein [Chthoniobacterales bacterium]|jgi:predicted enzyme related to lactoylglutathione lyase